jgi:hypothetical protein
LTPVPGRALRWLPAESVAAKRHQIREDVVADAMSRSAQCGRQLVVRREQAQRSPRRLPSLAADAAEIADSHRLEDGAARRRQSAV